MGSRRSINRKDISASAFKPKSNPLQTRGFSNGKKARSSELPTTDDILRTRPFSPRPSHSTKPEETLDFKTQLEFGYNALKIPTFTPAPESQIQQESEPGELTNTTAISGEVESEMDGEEDGNEEEKSQTESQSITEGENFGYNALKIPTFTPAPEPQIQQQSESGELTDTTAISGEVESEMDGEEDGNEEDKSETEIQSIAKPELINPLIFFPEQMGGDAAQIIQRQANNRISGEVHEVSDSLLGSQGEVISKENLQKQDSKYHQETVVQLARMLDPNGQECQALLEKIRNIIQNIKKRAGELKDDWSTLPEQAPGDDQNPSLSRRGHRRIINELKATLAQRKAEYVAKCGQLPDDVRESEDPNINWFQLPNIELPNFLEWIPPIPIWNPFRRTI